MKAIYRKIMVDAELGEIQMVLGKRIVSWMELHKDGIRTKRFTSLDKHELAEVKSVFLWSDVENGLIKRNDVFVKWETVKQ